MATFSDPIIAVFRPTRREYDFLQYTNDQTRRWINIDAPPVEGISYNYTHPLINKTTHITFHNGRRIDIKVTSNIIKLTGNNRWICTVDLPSHRYVNSSIRIRQATIPAIIAPANLNMGSWRPPPIQIPVSQQPNIFDDAMDLLATMYSDDIHITCNDKKMPHHIVKLIAQDAVNRGEVCPITMDDITLDMCAVTSCFHVFNRDALNTWHVSHNTCPVCKQICISSSLPPTVSVTPTIIPSNS